MNLFETQTSQQIFNGALSACNDLIERSNEADIQIQYYRVLINAGDSAAEEREMEREVTAEAMKDKRECAKQLQILANLFETQFGISA